MQARGRLNYRLKYCWVIYYICQPNEVERKIKYKTGGHGPPLTIATDYWTAKWLQNTARLRTFITDIGSTLLEWLCQEQRGFGLTASATASDVSVPADTNGAWPFLRPVGVAQN